MKKAVFLTLALLAASSSGVGVFAAESPLGLTGIGVYGSAGTTMGGGIGLSLKWGSFPVVGLKYNFDGGALNVSADYYVIDAEGLGKYLSYYLGVGAYAGIDGSNEDNPFAFGLRLPVGLQFWPVRKLELFLAPVVSVPLMPAPAFDLGAEFGVRVRF